MHQPVAEMGTGDVFCSRPKNLCCFLHPRCRRFAEEYHKLALALGGRFRKRPVPLQCAGQGQDEAAAAAAADEEAAQQRRRLW